MAASSEHVLLGDIGATNARFARLMDGVVGAVDTITVADHPRFTEAVEAFLGRQSGRTPKGAVLAVAGPVEVGRAALTNCPWVKIGRAHV